jgi:hypothetical protein
LVENLKGRDHSEEQGVDWMHLAHKDKWQVLVNTEMNLWVL